MEVYESVTKAMMRRRYKRLEAGGFAVQPKRVKVVAGPVAGGPSRRKRRTTQRLRLRGSCFRVMAIVKAATLRLLQMGRGGGNTKDSLTAKTATMAAIAAPPPVLLLPSNRPLRSSSNDVIDEVWFQAALRRSIAEGRLPAPAIVA